MEVTQNKENTWKTNTLKTITDLTPKQRLFVDTLVLNWGQKSKQDVAMEVFDCKDRTNASKYAYQLLHPDKSPHIVRYLEMQLAKELKKYETDKLRHYKTYERLQQKAEEVNFDIGEPPSGGWNQMGVWLDRVEEELKDYYQEILFLYQKIQILLISI